MITFIILLLLLAIGIFLIQKSSYLDDWDFIGYVVVLLMSLFITIHSIVYFTVAYSYEMWVIERNAFEQTLNEARQNGNEYETAAIVKEVAAWNQSLAKNKYSNKTWLLDQYIDDRVETLNPIK